MKTVRLILLFSIIFSITSHAMGLSENDSIPLIVGSYGKQEPMNFWLKCMVGDGKDFSHKETFNGNGYTLDINSSFTNSKKHFKCSAINFTPKFKLSKLYFELFPSVDIYSGNDESLIYLPLAIKNLTKFLEDGAVLEMEHFPFISLGGKELYDDSTFKTLRTMNPFHNFMTEYFIEMLDIVSSSKNKDELNELKNKFIKKFVKKDVSYEMETSMKCIEMAIQHIKKVASNRIKNFESEFDKRIEEEFSIIKENGLTSFFSSKDNSLNNLIAAISCVGSIFHNMDEMKNFLGKLGYKDVTIECKDNKYNGRKNVFMISAKYQKRV